jgi:hypothetical protein
MKNLLLLSLLAILCACSHPLEIIGEGDILSSTGTRDCYLEDFQAGKDSCAVNLVVRDYQETYYAMPRDGWMFASWKNYCTDGSTADQCSFNVDADVVRKFWGETAPPLVAVFEKSSPVAPVVFNDGGNHLIDYDISTGIRVEYQTSVTLAPGVTISGPEDVVVSLRYGASITINGAHVNGEIVTKDGSSIYLNDGTIKRVNTESYPGLTMTGGTVDDFYSMETTLTMSGGHISKAYVYDGGAIISGGVIGDFFGNGDAGVQMTGGRIEDRFLLSARASGRIKGGTVLSVMEIEWGASLSFYGDVTLTEPIAIDERTDTIEVHGTLEDGTPIDGDIECRLDFTQTLGPCYSVKVNDPLR